MSGYTPGGDIETANAFGGISEIASDSLPPPGRQTIVGVVVPNPLREVPSMIGPRIGLAMLVTVGLLVAGCGDDDDDESGETTAPAAAVPGAEDAAALQEDIADLSDDEQITRVGDEWADLFGKGDEAMCGYLHPDLGGATSCAEYVMGSLTQSSPLQASFEGATVESVEVDGETAFAEFSTDNRVRFEPDPDGAWKVIETPRVTGSGSDEVVQPE
jgi:hypothetical protein